MARYYFHVRTPSRFQTDDVGLDFADDKEARRQAVLGARDLFAEMAQAGYDISMWCVEIGDETGRTVASISFKDALGPHPHSSKLGLRSFILR